MPHGAAVPQSALQRLRRDIQKLQQSDATLTALATSPLGVMDSNAEVSVPVPIRQSFEVWTMDVAELERQTPRSLGELPARSTGRWHHQLDTQGTPQMYARSSQRQESLGRLLELIESPVAARIDAAVEWLGAPHTSDDDEARLLVIPAFYLTALWIVPASEGATSQVVVIEAPRELELPQRRLLPCTQFIEMIRRSSWFLVR